MLLTAVDLGLDACFFGVPVPRIDTVRTSFGIPAEYTPIGAISVGYRAADTPAQPGSWAAKRKAEDDVIRYGRWCA